MRGQSVAGNVMRMGPVGRGCRGEGGALGGGEENSHAPPPRTTIRLAQLEVGPFPFSRCLCLCLLALPLPVRPLARALHLLLLLLAHSRACTDLRPLLFSPPRLHHPPLLLGVALFTITGRPPVSVILKAMIWISRKSTVTANSKSVPPEHDFSPRSFS